MNSVMGKLHLSTTMNVSLLNSVMGNVESSVRIFVYFVLLPLHPSPQPIKGLTVWPFAGEELDSNRGLLMCSHVLPLSHFSSNLHLWIVSREC